jgi:hypothetical protein
VTVQQDTDGCGCCGITPAAAAAGNPPGLAAISYRSGIYGTVLRRMLAALGSRLGQLDPAATDDPAIALLDAWATVADVVTFYQERIANEGFLRTATERRSVLELAREIGYELRPGVAAAGYLDFRMQVPAAAAAAPGPAAPTTAVVAPGTLVRSVPAQGKVPQPFETSQEFTADAALNELSLRTRQKQAIGPGLTKLYLTGLTTGLRAGDPILVAEQAAASRRPARWEFRVLRSVETQPATAPDAAPATLVTWDDGLVCGYSQPEVYALGVRASMFGYNAPDWKAMSDQFRTDYASAVDKGATKTDPDWPGFSLPDKPQPSSGGAVFLDAVYPDIAANSYLVLRQPGVATRLYRVISTVPSGQAKFAISAKSSHVTVDRRRGLSWYGRRQVVVYVTTRKLDLAEAPIGGTVSGPVLDLAKPAPLASGQQVLITGTSAGAQVVQLAKVDKVTGTLVTLTQKLSPALDIESVRIAGNVVLATHGETVQDEVLGSGDGTAANQRFTLRKPNLTHVAAKTPSGVTDSLEIWVDGVLWTEVTSLYPAGPYDRVYVVRIADDATATVIFGDGLHGARLPTGQENVRARYRSGIGLDGLVDAHALTLLPQRPLGVATVDNPLPSTGAAAPETLAEARTNAPLTVLTLDRVVSLADYEDYARGYGGITKARAVALPDAAVPTVFITVAGPGGSKVQEEPTISDLRGALDTIRDRAAVVQVKSFRPADFLLGVQVLADPARLFTDVQAAVRQALEARFSADHLSFGQPVPAAAVIAATQAVDGVVAAKLTGLQLVPPPKPDSPAVEDVLTPPDVGPDPDHPGEILPASLLRFAPGQPDVGAWTP